MSRTPKRGKAPGYEYWSRGTPREATTPGRWSKKQRTRKRRREAALPPSPDDSHDGSGKANEKPSEVVK